MKILNRWTQKVIREVETLRGADLRGADLSDADLSDADLRGADLRGADLHGADLRGVDLRGADLSGANLRGATIPKIEDLDGKILAAIKAGGKLNMHSWHTCETTHCRAGWAVTIAGEQGKALETAIGTNSAAALIYSRAYPNLKTPDFYTGNDDALADIKKRAALAEP